MAPDTRPLALCLLGPTASGKTAAALALARQLPVEIISVDSALVYQGMDIGTAKPSAEERAVCPHHLIDLISPEEAYSAARFVADARSAMAGIVERGRQPVLVGGTMLYYKALRDGLSELPEADPALRQAIEDEARRAGWPALHAQLAVLDPATAARLHPTDAQRIQRALEVVRLTGAPLAAAYARRPDTALPCRLAAIGLAPSDRSWLHGRIARRFAAMLADGLVDELAALRRQYRLGPELPSVRCVGYRQVWDYLEGLTDLATARDRGIAATRQLAKRQLTWMRSLPELLVLDCLRPDLDAAVGHLACALQAGDPAGGSAGFDW